MIQFNLLPEVKLEYLKAQRMRRAITGISTLVTLAALIILGLMLSMTVLQRKHLSDLNADIKKQSASIKKQPDLDKILTIQNQLTSLTNLHNSKPAVSRLTGYLSQITPTKVNINNLKLDFVQHQMTITGTADSLATINQYVDTLKFTTYSSGTSKNQNAFSGVVLSSFGLTQHEADYTITLTYDSAIFDITQNVTLTVPNEVTTRSEIAQPSDLFQLPIDNPTTKAPGSKS